MSRVSDLGPIPGVPARFIESLNERFRRLSVQVSVTASSGGGSTAEAEITPYALWFGAPGTLAVQSDAAPRQYLNDSRTPVRVAAYLINAPTGSAATIRITQAGSTWLSLTIAAGSKTAVAEAPSQLIENTAIGLDVTAVGSTYPGSDLVVFVYFR